MNMTHLTLATGRQMPILGFGTWQLTGSECVSAVRTALDAGYRSIDTADRYGNHRDVGLAVKESGVLREDIFITTKVYRDELSRDMVLSSGHRFLDELGTDYIDLLLIHWPNSDIPLGETLGAMAELKASGIVRSIGVSNFTKRHIDDAVALCPDIEMNQVEFHPSLNQKDLHAHCVERGIQLTAYSPIAQGADLEIPLVKEFALKYGRSPSQVCLNWIMGKSIAVIPRASNPDYIRDNSKALEWELSPEDSAAIDALSLHNRVNAPPHHEFGEEL